MLEYEEYLKQLPEGQVGKIEVTQKDVKLQTVRARLNRASKNLELDIQTKRVANVVLLRKKLGKYNIIIQLIFKSRI